MFSLRSSRKISCLLFMSMIVFLSACSNFYMPDQFDIETFTGSTFSTIPYNEKKREPLPGEFPMIKMEIYDDLAANSHAISNRVSEKIPQDTSQIYYYKNNDEIVL